MKECRICGTILPPRKLSENQIKVAKKNINHFTKYLAEEGSYLPIDTKKSIEKIMHESHLWLKGEYTWDEAICEKCKSKGFYY